MLQLSSRGRPHKLATVRKDGRPHVVPVWFDFDGHTIVFTAWHESVKAINMRRDARVCICLDDERPPFNYVQVEGEAELPSDRDDLRDWSTRIAGKYMGQGAADRHGGRNSIDGELLVRVRIAEIIGQKDVAGW